MSRSDQSFALCRASHSKDALDEGLFITGKHRVADSLLRALFRGQSSATILDRVGEYREVAIDLQDVLIRQIGSGAVLQETRGSRAVLTD